jgi:hypothetical protein
MDAKELDGKYQVTTLSDYDGPVPMRSDGVTEIKDGKTSRVDQAGVKWATVLTPLNDDEVLFESTADPTDAAGDFCLTLPSGNLTRDPVVYKAKLKVSRKGDKIRLSGQIEHGKVVTVITMTKI